MKEAMLYEKLDEKKVHCYLCSHHCKINPGGLGICQVRQNIDGTLYSLVYDKAIALNVDPIEKKPIFHMLPGSKSFSIATLGCNFRCGFCQNWEISQAKEAENIGTRSVDTKSEEIVKQAKEYHCKSISYTYTEPTVFFEYAYETCKLAKEAGLDNVFVTNGYMTKEALEILGSCLDAANVDLKFFDDEKYQKICGARLEPVLENIRLMRKLDIWVEVTTLIVPGQNDSSSELKELADFLVSVGKEIPWHISRFHPDYKMTDIESTPLATLKMAYKIGKDAGLRYVYLGNVPDEENTHCYNCNGLLISRLGFSILKNKLNKNKCPNCDTILDGKALNG